MTTFTALDLADAFLEHRETFGVSIIFGTKEITAIVAESQFSRELVEGGFAEAGDLKCKLLLSDLPATPEIGSPVIYEKRPFKVSSRAIQPGSLIGEFDLHPARR